MHTRAASWLRHRLGRAVVLSYTLALILPGPGLWLRVTRHRPSLVAAGA
ncbi:hypothetical protein [Streptomyces sp. NPDC001500]